MAYAPEFIEKVGIYFETHDDSAKEVAETHGVSRSIMYGWIEKYGWIQNKYQGVRRSAGGLIDEAAMRAVREGAVDAVVGEVMEADAHTGHVDKDRAKKIAGGLIREVLTLDQLNLDASQALANAREIAITSTKLNDQRIWLDCVKTGKEIIFGKNPDMVFLGDFSKITDVDIANMSQEELLRLAKMHEDKKEG
ncbi:hypothetical protein [Sulfuricurvum sp.]|uniref:hypothetical protein n=1 Tax=Sulfuricurvum sp. TaxID=2025608 RepID=UPI00262C341F|nr:hypothetical protein [Sulfuricurvum sp.]MDD2267480.1 hypothetical protein [Sulfuricurvum sp.]MDD2783972.1 hypothetical protein [Sulfuricurvum sp.]